MQPNQPSSFDPQQQSRQQPAYGQQPQYGQSSGHEQPGDPALYAQPGQYGQPGQHGQPASGAQAGAMPGVVKWGLGIQWVGVAFSVFALIVGVASLFTLGAGEAMFIGLLGVTLAVSAVIFAVQVVAMIFATKGRNWARITLAALAILGIVTSFASGAGINIGSAISILSIALLFMPDATAWYRARSGQR